MQHPLHSRSTTLKPRKLILWILTVEATLKAEKGFSIVRVTTVRTYCGGGSDNNQEGNSYNVAKKSAYQPRGMCPT